MGACQCRQEVSYEVNPRKKQGIVPKAGQESPEHDFDSLKSSRLESISSNVQIYTPNGIKISPRASEEEEEEEKKCPSELDFINTLSTINSLNCSNCKGKGSETEEDCNTISSRSGSFDSDFGSESLSVANSSARSERGLVRHSNTKFTYDSNTKNTISNIQRVIRTMNSQENEDFEALDTVGCLPSEERPYLNSRLDIRADSQASGTSLEIIQWKRGNRLGRGTFGTVYLGLTNTGELLAVKQIELIGTEMDEIEKEYDKIFQEVSLLKSLHHKNIVGYIGSNYENNCISVFMEYVPGGSLASIILRFGPLEEQVVTRYTKQLLEAVTYLHENHIVHRDIKSANMMLMPDSTIKLIDFGCAKRLALRLSRSGSHLQKSLRGTPYWMAPEVINESGHGKKSDIWSLGCTTFEMFTGKPPWGDREPIAAIYAIGSDDFEVPYLPEKFSADAQDFVKLCMIRDKHKRPTAKKLIRHPFVSRPSSNTSVSLTRGARKMSSIRRSRPDELPPVS